MTLTKEFFVRHKYWHIKFHQEQNEWVAVSEEIPELHLRGMYRLLVEAIPGEIERLVGEPDRNA